MPIDSGNQWSLMRKTKKKEKVGHVNNAQLLSLLTLSPNQAIISWNFGTWFRLPPIPIYIHSVFQCKRTIIKFKKKKENQNTCLRSSRDKLDMAKNLVASLPVMRPSLSENTKCTVKYFQKTKKYFLKKNHWKMNCAVLYLNQRNWTTPYRSSGVLWSTNRLGSGRTPLIAEKLRNRVFEMLRFNAFYLLREQKTWALNDDEDLH